MGKFLIYWSVEMPFERAALQPPRVYIIVLNWNGWRDTIECLESLFRLRYPYFCVVVCDNNSSDQSVERIIEWANGQVLAGCANPDLLALTAPAVIKPICHDVLELPFGSASPSSHAKLVIIKIGANLGYAGGNNTGLRYALNRGDLKYAWILNNDTVVRADTLETLVERMLERPTAGLCGSTLLYYFDPHKVQAMAGAVYNKWTARSKELGTSCSADEPAQTAEVEQKLSYIVGASVLVSKPFLETIGLMDESYFLYFEEIDWATRARGKFSLVYSPKSIVYHKEGATTGSGRSSQTRTLQSERFATRNRLLFTMRYHSAAIASVWLAVFASACQRLLSGKTEVAMVVLRELFSASKLHPFHERENKGKT